ncbi:hypothetical protein [Serratia proteamaculans]|uniref:hypothetical protein n=1 Tax=Serratia proteamaculans TaxID=28151 RepID=UPI0010223C60|nr:hypothetical protein [Serratia proteamaculans]
MSLYNVDHNLAHVTGTTQADQAGLELDVMCKVTDSSGTLALSGSVNGTWGEPEVQQGEPEEQQSKKSKSTK